MKFLFDSFPILLFFVAFKFFGIYAATAVAIGATMLQVLYLWFAKKKIEYMVWVNLGVIGVFGGLTLFFHNETFIKWKPTILYSIFAGALFTADYFYKKNLLQTMMTTALDLPERTWRAMNYSWVFFFIFLAVLNIAVAYSVSTEQWVNFKLFGLIGLTFAFAIGQSIFLARYIGKTSGESSEI